MNADTVAAIGGLFDERPVLLPILQDHLEGNFGQVLPHLILSDVVRWMEQHEADRPEDCRAIVDWMNRRYERGPDEVRNLIVVSGVEMFPAPGDDGADLFALLSPALRAHDPWER